MGKDIKPIRGKTGDFFKLCKSKLGLKKIHKYTPKSVEKTTILISRANHNTRLQLQNSPAKAF
jgi:hypothetical protein